MEIRKITAKDRKALMDLYRYAYTEWSDQEIKDEELEEILTHETLGLFENGRLVSSTRIHEFQQSVRGVLKDCGGIAGVASYPEARHKGYVRHLMLAGFKEMYEQESMLDPFKPSFYAKFGYTTANAPYLVKAPIKHLKHTAREDTNPEWSFERLRAVDAKDTLLGFIREIGPAQYHGFIIFKSIPDGMWKRRVKDSVVVFVKYKGVIQAASRYRIKGERREGRWISELTVIDILWRTREARMKLFDFFATHQDQINDIIIHAPFETRVEHWFEDARLSIERKAPWMVRVIDVRKAVENLPATGEDIVTMEISDPDCLWNNGVFTIQSEKNCLQVNKSSGKPVVKLSIKAFSSLVYGTLSVEELEFQGEITITEDWARHTLQRWFPLLPLYNVVYF
jgi:predicted acetyltransferase